MTFTQKLKKILGFAERNNISKGNSTSQQAGNDKTQIVERHPIRETGMMVVKAGNEWFLTYGNVRLDGKFPNRQIAEQEAERTDIDRILMLIWASIDQAQKFSEEKAKEPEAEKN